MERYGLFKRLANGAAMWVCAADDLKQAMSTIQSLSEQTGLEYFIHDFQAGTVIASSRKTKPSAIDSSP
ncbi:hypothetical protein SBA2_670094 [Acidobacteriia bacterium SbA2]|nr:hypothetical protein SBA2_670094 [Acidobacteriia bacterium SbA2]